MFMTAFAMLAGILQGIVPSADQNCAFATEYPVTFSGAENTDTMRIESVGDDCAHVVFLITVRNSDRQVVHDFALPLDRINYHGNPRPQTEADIRRLLVWLERTEFYRLSLDNPQLSAGHLPPFSDASGEDHRIMSAMESWGEICAMDPQHSYTQARDTDAPLICHAVDDEYGACFWYDPRIRFSRAAFVSCY